MRIVVLGATGGTGRELVTQAVGRGWQVRVVVRSVEGLPADLDPGVSVLTGNVLDPAVLQPAVAGTDAVLTALGFRRHLTGPAGTTLYSDSARALVATMTGAAVRRLVFITSAGVEDHDPHDRWVYDHVVRPLWLQQGYDDMKRAEAILAESPLDWVVVRPGRLTDGPATGDYVVSPRFRPAHANAVSRADLASFMLDQVTSSEWVHATPTLGTPQH